MGAREPGMEEAGGRQGGEGRGKGVAREEENRKQVNGPGSHQNPSPKAENMMM